MIPSVVLALSIASVAAAEFPAFETIRAATGPSELVLLDRNGREIQRTRKRYDHRRLAWAPLVEIPDITRVSLLGSEDRRFDEHHGVDWIGLTATAVRNVFGSRPRGASTLTMQLVTLLRPAPRRREWSAKWGQVRAALALEREWTKAQILEAYLNLVPFRSEWVGIRAAARGLFGRELYALDRPTSAVLAALLRAPSAPAPLVWDRACKLLASLDCEVSLGARASFHLPTHPLTRPEENGLAPELAERLARTGTVRTTLDRDLQKFALERLRIQLATLKAQNVTAGALIVLDNRTGETLAQVGGPGSDWVDGTQALRQAGSTLKPFLYLRAIEDRRVTASTLIEDTPLDVLDETGRAYRPENFDHVFHGPVPVRTALGSSLNVPAVRVLERVGVSAFHDLLARLGLRSLARAERYGPSMILGSVDVTLSDLTDAYRALANGGTYSHARLFLDDPRPAPRSIFRPESTFIVSSILADRDARALTFGWESPVGTAFWSAVKTGTSKDMRDNWCIGFSERYTVGVWIGNLAGEPMRDVTGMSGAGPLWFEVMSRLHRRVRSSPPVPGKAWANKLARSEGEWYLRGTEPTSPLPNASAKTALNLARITYPPDGLIVAFDPDIPLSHQRLPLEVSRPAPDYRWILDGAELENRGADTTIALAQPGIHSLELYSPDRRALDRVTFRVRGAEPSMF